jgi:hypothetical protein
MMGKVHNNIFKPEDQCRILGSHSGGYENFYHLHSVISQKIELFRKQIFGVRYRLARHQNGTEIFPKGFCEGYFLCAIYTVRAVCFLKHFVLSIKNKFKIQRKLA